MRACNPWYPVQLWLTSVVFVGPLLLLLWGPGERMHQWLPLLPVFMVFGLLLSLIVSVCYGVYGWLRRKGTSTRLIKILLNGLALLGVWLLFGWLGGAMARSLGVVYAASIVLTSLGLRIDKADKS